MYSFLMAFIGINEVIPFNKPSPGDNGSIDRQRMVKRVISPTKTLLLGSEPIAETTGDRNKRSFYAKTNQILRLQIV